MWCELQKVCETLNERQKIILNAVFERKDRLELAKELGITRERVGQLMEAVIEVVQKRLSYDNLPKISRSELGELVGVLNKNKKRMFTKIEHNIPLTGVEKP